MFLFCIILLLLCLPSLNPGQSYNYKFNQYTTAQNLSQNTVHSILQDSQGFLWIASRDGLNKYDGYEFKHYYHLPSKINSLTNNSVNSICESKFEKNVIWIGTSVGLNKLYTCSDKFEQFTDKDSLCSSGIYYIYEDSKGNIWIGTTNGLSKFDNIKRKFINYFSSQIIKNPLSRSIISIIEAPRGSGMIWVGTGDGLSKFDSNTDSRQEINLSDYSLDKTNPTHIYTLECYNDSILLIGTSKGLSLLNIKTEKPIYYPSLNQSLKQDNSIRSIRNSSLYKDIIWIASFNNLYRFNIKNDLVEKVSVLTNNNEKLSSLYVFEDRFGVIWLGTYRWGLFKITPMKEKFNRLDKKLAVMNYPVKTPVWAINKTKDGVLWVGSTNGLYKLDFNNNSKRLYLNNILQNQKDEFPVRAIVNDSQNNRVFWIGSLGKGLIKFDAENENATVWSLIPFCKTGHEENYVYTVIEDSKNNLWVGTNGGGLYKFNKNTGKAVSYKHILEDNTDFLWVTSIFESKTGCLWIGTFMNGILKFLPQTGSFERLLFNNKEKQLSNVCSILSVYEDKDLDLWIGTNGEGLYKYIIKENTLVNYTTEDGLPDNVIFNIIEDNSNCLWLTTNRGLSRFNKNTGTFINYFYADGLKSNDFNLGAFCKSGSGEIFLGSSLGFNSFFPDSLFNLIPPKTVITAFSINGENILFEKPINELDEIDLSYNENSISFKFASLHFLNPSKNQIKYKLEGYNTKWNYSCSKQQVNYFRLPPGKYIFKIHSANCDGIWDEKGKSLAIIISPAYWKTWWFYSVLVMILSIIVYFFIKFRVRSLVKIEKIKFEEREKIRKKIADDFHDELGHTATQISLTASLLKNELYKQSTMAEDLIGKISSYSKILYDEMRTLNWELDPEKDSLYDLIVTLKNFSDSLFDKTQIALELNGDLEAFKKNKLDLEVRKQLLRIFKEGLHNILKHADGCRNVAFNIEMQSNNVLTINLKNDGRGYDTNNINYGNGINSIRRRSQSISADLDIYSEIDNGTTLSLKVKLS